MEISSQQGSRMQLYTPSKDAPSTTYRSPEKPKINPLLKNSAESCLDQLQAVLKHHRPISSPFTMSNPQIEATPLYHRENKGLRSEGKFRKYIENVKEIREKSQAILHKNIHEMGQVHNHSPERIEDIGEYLDDFMEKHYLKSVKKQDIANIRFTRNADAQIQEKKFKSMKKALDEVNYERKNPKKVVKYITNNHVDPHNLAIPKFVSYESKVKAPQKINPVSYKNEQLTFDKAKQELFSLNVADKVETMSSYYHLEDPFEQNKEQLKKLKDSIVSFEKSVSMQKQPSKVVETVYTEETAEDLERTENTSPFRGTGKPHNSKKNTSKKSGIERRIQGTKPIEDLIKGAILSPEKTENLLPTQMSSPLTPNFDFSATKLSVNLSNFASPVKLPQPKSAGIFGNTQVDEFNSRMVSPLSAQNFNENRQSADLYGFESHDHETKDLILKRYTKMKKMLQYSPQSKHIRVTDDRIASRERYNVMINSAVSFENAEKVITQSKVQFFQDKIIDPRRVSLEKIDKSYFTPAEKTKAKVFDAYKNLSEACQSNAKSMPALQRGLKKNFGVLSDKFKNMNQQFGEGELLDLNDQIKQDILAEMQNLSSATFKPSNKNRKALSAYSKKR